MIELKAIQSHPGAEMHRVIEATYANIRNAAWKDTLLPHFLMANRDDQGCFQNPHQSATQPAGNDLETRHVDFSDAAKNTSARLASRGMTPNKSIKAPAVTVFGFNFLSGAAAPHFKRWAIHLENL